MRFDEVELLKEPELQSPESLGAILPGVSLPTPAERRQARRIPPAAKQPISRRASRVNRGLAFLTDLSLFLALALALSPLLPYQADWQMTVREEWPTLLALGAFLLLLSYYYFVMGWLIWGRTVGGAIFDVRVVSADGGPMSARNLSRRWAAMLLSILLGGLGFLPALLPGGGSLADRLSHTRSLAA